MSVLKTYYLRSFSKMKGEHSFRIIYILYTALENIYCSEVAAGNTDLIMVFHCFVTLKRGNSYTEKKIYITRYVGKECNK